MTAQFDAEAAAYLRLDNTLMAILTGKVWLGRDLGTEGITNPKTTPSAYSGGVLKPCCVVRVAGEIEAPGLGDEVERVSGQSSKLMFWLYQAVAIDALITAKNRIHYLMQERRFSTGAGAKRVFTLDVMPSPEMANVNLLHVDYAIAGVRHAAIYP